MSETAVNHLPVTFNSGLGFTYRTVKTVQTTGATSFCATRCGGT